MSHPSPTRLYRTYSVLGEQLSGASEKVSISEVEVPEALLLEIGDRQVLLSRGAWENLIAVATRYNYSDFTWVPREIPTDESSS